MIISLIAGECGGEKVYDKKKTVISLCNDFRGWE